MRLYPSSHLIFFIVSLLMSFAKENVSRREGLTDRDVSAAKKPVADYSSGPGTQRESHRDDDEAFAASWSAFFLAAREIEMRISRCVGRPVTMDHG